MLLKSFLLYIYIYKHLFKMPRVFSLRYLSYYGSKLTTKISIFSKLVKVDNLSNS